MLEVYVSCDVCKIKLGYFQTEINAKVVAAAFLCPKCRLPRGYVDTEMMKGELKKMKRMKVEGGYEGTAPLPRTK